MKIFEITLFWITIAPSYYWLMYVLSFIVCYLIIKKRTILWNNKSFLTQELIDDLFLYMFLWIILWWRFGYIVFYNFNYFLHNLIDIFKFWEWWMSFHWWVLWVIFAMILFSRKYKIDFYRLSDEITAVLPIWLWFWRIWNYLNKELLGFSNYFWPFSVNWRFPSPLLEFLLEWIVLWIILNLVYKKRRFNWQVASLFLIFYWTFRIFVEMFFRLPDEHIWYIFNLFTLWEILSFPMILFWLYFYIFLKKNKKGL